MSHLQSREFKRPENVVRLKIDGAKTSVNTLRDEETAGGVSLVCPFPALEVDIPVRFGDAENMSAGAIHRIGVEDDPTTGLPRLRLAIRNRDTRATAPTKISESLQAATNVESADPSADTGNMRTPKDLSFGPKVKPAGSWAEFLSEISDSCEEPSLREQDERETDIVDMYSLSAEGAARDEDPQWAVQGEMPLPENMEARTVTRRRFKMVRHIAVAFVLGMSAASLYLFDCAGVISFSGIKDKIVAATGGESQDASEKQDAASMASTAPKRSVETSTVTPEQVAEVASNETPSEPSAPSAALPAASGLVEAAYTPGPNPLMKGIDVQAPSADSPTQTADNASAQPSRTADSLEKKEEDAASQDDVTLLLPTRWPVEYASAYRVREPNGVVVDVPGGLVKREGWLENGKENPMVRSIKSIQRESGARFIVYVNGGLPRFITSPKQNGVSLRLYFDDDEMNTAAVASLEK